MAWERRAMSELVLRLFRTYFFSSLFRRKTAVQCRGIEKNGVVGAWHGEGMASVNQIRPHCVNQMGKTRSKPLAARHGMAWHGMGAAWARHAMCESVLKVLEAKLLLYTPRRYMEERRYIPTDYSHWY